MKIETKLLLKPEDFKPSFSGWTVEGVLNPAAIRLPNRKIFLYARVAENSEKHGKGDLHCPVIVSKNEYKTTTQTLKKREIVSRDRNVIYLKSGVCRLTNISHFRRVILNENGFDIEKISKIPDFTGTADDGEYGVEDSRIVKIGNEYLMTYVTISERNGISTSLAISKDLKKWKRKGIIFREQNKDGVLFPEKISGGYVALNRPEAFYEFHRPSIWISFSRDLIYWGKDQNLIMPRKGSWEEERIGTGPPPIKTSKGWLVIYHGVKKIRKDSYIYSVGSLLLDLKNPRKIIARTKVRGPLIKPTKKYEKGELEAKDVVFPSGAVPDLNNTDLLIYSGAGDIHVSVRKIALKDIFRHMEYY